MTHPVWERGRRRGAEASHRAGWNGRRTQRRGRGSGAEGGGVGTSRADVGVSGRYHPWKRDPNLVLEEPSAIVAILRHLGLPTEAPPLARARAPANLERVQ